MADSYVDNKVREAMIAAKGSRGLAQRMLITWALSDERLLQGMARPFLKAITGAAIEGAIRRGTAPQSSGVTRPQRALTKEALDAVLNQMGRSMPAPTPPPVEPVRSRTPAQALSAPPLPPRGTPGPPIPVKVAEAPELVPQLTPQTLYRPIGGKSNHEAAMRTIAAAFARKDPR